MELSQGIKDLFQRLKAIDKIQQVPDDVERIEVDDIASKLATLYEKIRNTIDYREDHLLRRFALERDIRRKLLVDNLQPEMARSMVENLIRGHYLANNSLPETIIAPVQAIIEKYRRLFELLNPKAQNAKNKRNFYDWLVGIMSCEIDYLLAPELRMDALIEAMYVYVKDRVKIKGEGLSEREKNIQIYIAIHRDLLASDRPIISYHLFNLYFPDWTKNNDARLVDFVADKLPSIYSGIQKHLNYPHLDKIRKSLKRELAIFKVLKDLLIYNDEHTAEELLGDPELFEQKANKTLTKINQRIRRKIRRSSMRAIFYIFLTKMVLAFIIEYPYDLWVVQHVNVLALMTNIIFPPFLMFLVALTAHMPGKQSYKNIIQGLMTYVYGVPEDHTLIVLRRVKQRKVGLAVMMYLFYTALYCLIFGTIIYWLHLLGFNYVSIALFIFFVTIVSFFAVRIREQGREFDVVKHRQGVFVFIFSFLSLPIIKIGQFLSSNMRRINIFTFIFDFILEAPFKVFVEALETWFGFLREKREDIYKQ